MNRLTNLLMLLASSMLTIVSAHAQYTISGTIPAHATQTITLEGFKGLETYKIDAGRADSTGHFSLTYKPEDEGMGLLKAGKGKAFIVILSGEEIELAGEALDFAESITVVKGKQNQQMAQYAREQPRREQAISAWSFLQNIYVQDSLFGIHAEPVAAIAKEMRRINDEAAEYLADLDPQSYVRWFLPIRQLVSSVQSVARYRVDEIMPTIEAFRKIDYADPRLYKSGLLREAIESHYWLIENSGRSLDSAYMEMNISTDRMMDLLIFDEEKLNLVTDHLFNFLEKRSLFEASEYLALKVLNEVSCTIDDNLAKQLEGYRKMKKGNTAPDFTFSKTTLKPTQKEAEKLSDIKARYTVIAFAASWCGHCQKEIPKLAAIYPKLQANDIEVVLVSLDEVPEDYAKFVAKLPFISTCDFKKWDCKTVQDYHVFGTPTFYIVDNDLKIYIRPKSVDQIEALADYNLKKQ